MADEDDIRIGVAADLDDQSASALGVELERALIQAMTRAAPKIADVLSKQVSKRMRNLGEDTFDGLAAGARKAADATKPLSEQLATLEADFRAIEERADATRRTLARVGADPGLFAVIDRELDKVASTTRRFNDDLERIADNPDLLKGYQVAFQNARDLIFREVAGIQSNLRNLSDVQRIEGNRANQAADRVAAQRLADSRQANARLIVAQQGANAQILAETRIAGQQQIQQERIRARTRIELVRFTFNQIQALERGIAGIFRATGSVANSAFRTLEGAARRIGGLFTRSNTDLNQGLIGALRQRESTIERSFDRQTRSVRTSVNQQSVILERFEAQASTGVFGALTGRSAVGSLIGGGLAVGGGFALFQGLREGLEVGGDFVQGLAVLQAQLELTDAQMQNVREQSIALGNDITLPGVSALDAAQAIQIAAKQFAALGDGALPAAQAAARGILQLSRATGVAAEEAARVVGSAVNVFGVQASEATAVADQVTNALKNAAGVAFTDYANSFTQAAAVTKLFIGPAQDAASALAETNAAIAVLARGGIIGSDAGTSLRQFFLQANRGTDDAKEKLAEVTERAGEAGSVFFDASGAARTLADSLDILRRGTEGLTDQDLNATLQKLFGSDAARAAALLIRSTDAEFRKLIDANLELGTAAEIAAAQNVGLRGALDALGSVIETQQIKTYEKYQGALGKVVLRFSELLNAFFEGRGVFGVIQAGLQGIAVALGALLAAKAAAEAISFLGIALRGLVTPLGLVVTGISALGAAVSILRETSPAFRQETDLLAKSLTGDLRGAASRIGDQLARLADIIRVRLLPRLADLVSSALNLVAPAAEKIAAAFALAADYAGAFVQGLSGEGVTSDGLFGFVERLGVTVRSLGIAVDGFIDTLRGEKIDPIDGRTEERQQAIVLLAEKLGAALRSVGEQADDVVRGIADIGSALLDVINGGDVTPLRDRIVDNFTSFGNFVIDKVEPELQLIVGFIGDFLSGAANTAGGRISGSVQSFLLGPFQDAARALGRFLGNLVTDPRLVQALEQLVGLAVITGVNFVAGFAQGVGSNLDELGDLFGNQILTAVTAGMKAAFSNPFAFAQIIAGALIVSRVVSAFNRFGEAGALETSKGFAAGLRRRAIDGATFTRAFFGGPGFLEQQAGREAERAKRRVVSVYQSVNRDLQRLGQTVGGRIGVIDEAALERANQRLVEARERLGQVGANAVLARARTNEAFSGMSQVATGFVSILKRDVPDGLADVRVGAGKIRLALTDAFNDMAEQAGGRSQAIGSLIGTGIVSGVGAALAGQQLGSASSTGERAIGLAGIISSALLPALTIPGPAGLAISGFAATIGILTAAFSDNGAAAEEAARKLEGYSDALERNGSIVAASADLGKQVTDALADISTDALELAAQAGFDAQQFARQAAQGSRSAFDAVSELAAGLGVAQSDVEAFRDQVRSFSPEGVLFALNNSEGEQFRRVLDDAGVDVEVFGALVDGILGEQGSLFEAVRRFNAIQLVNPAFDPRIVATGAEVATRGVNGLSDAADRYYDALRVTDPLQQQVIESSRRAAEAAEQNLANITAAIESLNQARTADIQAQIGELTGALDLARTVAQGARDNLTQFLSGNYLDTARQKLDDLLLSIPGLGSQLDEALTLTPTLAAAQTNQTLAAFGQSVSAAIQAGIAEGTINAADPASVRNALAPFFAAIDELAARGVDNGGISGATADKLRGQIESLIGSDSFDLLTSAIFDADSEVARIQDEIDELNVDLLAKVYFDPAQIRAAAAELGLLIGAIPQSIAPTAATADSAERAGGVAGLTRVDNASLAQAVSDAQLAAERNAAAIAQAVREGASVDTAERSVEVRMENTFNIASPEPIPAAQEVVLGLTAAGRGIGSTAAAAAARNAPRVPNFF